MRKFCPYCGKQITAGAIKCHYCGRTLKDSVSQKTEGNESKKKKNNQIEYCPKSLFELVKSDISDISDTIVKMILNQNMRRRNFYELQPRNPKKQIRQL